MAEGVHDEGVPVHPPLPLEEGSVGSDRRPSPPRTQGNDPLTVGAAGSTVGAVVAIGLEPTAWVADGTVVEAYRRAHEPIEAGGHSLGVCYPWDVPRALLR